ncbi:hypothetical protein SKA34_10905 [Photobacterium sp. SKA34]|uniref:hypothetical protein n=1 Tax=Photobacterium sp. SKA34 TaxID=121723 RepID=UPI00006BEE23|nr:hypothetical protein [Photobacterium sp. SKA34]EAR53433.1 hypothetical protein SKA34_10905 [Photobacterium sp. SKA34]
MNPIRIYIRDILGLGFVGMIILAMLGIIFAVVVVGAIYYLTGVTDFVPKDIHLSMTYSIFLFPVLLIGYAISRPKSIAIKKLIVA